MEPVIVIDIGNTSTSAGLFRNGRVGRVQRLETSRTTVPSVQKLLSAYRAPRAVVASVAPQIEPAWMRALHVPTLWVRSKLNFGIPVTYPRPNTIGADRLANACGGVARYGAPLIVIDFGTAVTFDLVTLKGGYVGGVIAPGLPLMFSYLAEKTAKLPMVGPGPTPTRLGKSTEEAMRLGARWGYRGMVREIVAELMRRPELRKARLVATGGYADWVLHGFKPRMIVDHDLTLYGLGKISELNP